MHCNESYLKGMILLWNFPLNILGLWSTNYEYQKLWEAKSELRVALCLLQSVQSAPLYSIMPHELPT